MTLFGYDISQFLAGMMIGGAIVLFLLIKILSGFLLPSNFGRFNNFSQSYPSDYHARTGYRDRRGGSGFIFFLLILVIIIFAVKMLSNGGLSIGEQKNLKGTAPVTYDYPAPSLQLQGIGEGASSYPPPDYVYPVEETEAPNVREESIEETQPETDQYIVQTDCFNDYAQALKRAKGLQQKYDLPFGVIIKETAGQTKYASFVGPFPSCAKAKSVDRKYSLQGWIQPYQNFENLEQ